MPPPPGKKGAAAPNLNKAKGGGPPGGAAKCEWKLHVKVHSQERFWPKEGFAVSFGPKDLKSTWYASNAKMVAKDSPEVLFCGAGPKDGGVTAKVHEIKKEFEWILANGAASKDPLPNKYVAESIKAGDDHKVDLYIRHPLEVNLEFKFKDPENKELLFPKDFPVKAYHKTDLVAEKKIDEKGRIHFEMDRKYDWFTLKFGGDDVFFSVGDGKAGKVELKTPADQEALMKAEAKFFGPPKQWSLIESIWKFSENPKFIDGAEAYKEKEGKIYVFKAPTKNWVRRIGEKTAPIVLTLDPHWQFNRWEYFDRYHGHASHAHERVLIPPVLVEGFWNKGKDKQGSAHWVINEKSAKDAVLSLPWILQKKDTGVKAEKPDKSSSILFQTKAGTYACAIDANTRKIEVIPAADKRLLPSADRLKIYDLPAVWKTEKYWTRFGTGAAQKGKFWEDWGSADLLKSRSAKSPILFSLDDIILTDAALAAVPLAKTDRFAFFYHRFKPAYNEAANVSDHGVYMPDAAQPYYSNVKLKGAKFNYLADYPNWIRLIAGNSSLWDAFDQRTSAGVFGARAAVRWHDAKTAAYPPIALSAFLPQVNKPFFTIEPHYGQEHHFTWQQFNAGAFRIGRFDMALARCCDQLAGKELFLNMQYFRLLYTFFKSGNSTAAKKTAFMKDSAVGLMNRWNGNDAVNTSRTELPPQDATKNLQGEVIWFIQPAAAKPPGHYDVKVTKMGANARAWMNGVRGTGEVDDTYAKSSPTYGTANAYVLAHELGHGGSLPDEYAERSSRCSHGTAGITCNTPGDPFVDEGLYPDLKKSLYGGANPPYPMMTHTVEMRNRYFWHNAEFARQIVKEPLFVKHGAFHEYKVPGHPNIPRRTYVYWPVANAMNNALGAKGKADIYLHAAGKERYTNGLMPNGPYDGLLSVLVKINLLSPGGDAIIRNAIRNTVLAYNHSYWALGDVDVTTDKGVKSLNISKAMLRMSPRFIIQNVDNNASNKATYAKDYANLLLNPGKHFTINIVNAKVGASGFNAGSGAYDFVIDYTDPNVANVISTLTEQYFREMIGVAFDPANPTVIKAADLKGFATAVFTKNGNVKK